VLASKDDENRKERQTAQDGAHGKDAQAQPGAQLITP
jgi:hypothetical protein